MNFPVSNHVAQRDVPARQLEANCNGVSHGSYRPASPSRVVLVDDEPLALARLEVALADIPDLEIVGCAVDGSQASELITSLHPDLVILDIRLPGLSGIDLARSLECKALRPEIIFVTAFNRFAIEAFQAEAVDYLLKPVSFDRLRVSILRAQRRIALRRAKGQVEELSAIVAALREDAATMGQPSDRVYDAGIWVPSRQGAIRVDVQTIDWIESARDYVLLNTPTRSHIMRAKISELEKRIDPRIMIRIHRSHMVRLQAVAAVERPGKGALRLLLNDGANLQVGPTFQEQVCDALKL